ncbi:hypothetical protein ABID21_002560 [Pseudorhizobium tarimense]|uniref:Transposase n=1 Tax=Pseudorhizobium tarimense TaxID=1079109 RepID=A0ABV2H7N3_9HYPH
MNEQGPDVSLLIGLHKLAQQNGDGLVPELYSLLVEPLRSHADMADVIPFPAERRETVPSAPVIGTNRILTFRR